MGIQATQDQDKPKEGQQPTPEAKPVPQPDPAVVELQRKLEALEKQVSDKDRYITELTSEKATLESRLTQVKPQAEAIDPDLQRQTAEILEAAQIDPQKAGEKLSLLIKTATTQASQETLKNIEPLVSQQLYVNEVKAKNADLMELGLEPGITLRASQLMQSGKSFKDAVDIAVSEARSKVEKLTNKSVATPPPAGAVGETAANRQPEPPAPQKEMTAEDEINAERQRRRKMGL